MSEEAAPATPIEGAAPATPEAPAAAPPAGTEGQAPAAEVAAPTSDAIRPEGLPDQFWEDGKGVKVGDLWTAFRDMQTKAEDAAKDVPADATGYALAIPEGVKLPEGLDAAALTKDPFFAAAQGIAHEIGLPKAAFDKLAAAYVKDIADAHQEQATAATERYVEAKKALGENVDKRIGAARDWLKANLSEAQAKAVMGAPLSADLIKGLETIIALRTGPMPGGGVNNNVGKFDGLRGAELLDAIRTSKAA